MIYLDNAATTPMSKKALDVYNLYASEQFYNPSGIYDVAVAVKNDIEEAKETIKHALHTLNGNIIFTSSATEANNLAIFGCLKSNFKKIVLSKAEHPSVYNIGIELQNRGFNVEFCPLQSNGQIDYEALEEILDENTNLISIMHISNETGAINDLKKINEIRKRKCPKAILHVDGVQAFTKIKVNLDYFGVDLYTISAHKINGPKGVAALFVKNNLFLKPITFGGGQEQNIRSGTENVPAIMAFKTAIQDVGDIDKNFEYVSFLKKIFLSNLNDLPYKNNSGDENSPYILSLSFKGVKGETLVHMLEEHKIYISTGSACSSKKSGNRVLLSMNISPNDIVGSVRISFSKNNTEHEVIEASKILKETYYNLIDKLR